MNKRYVSQVLLATFGFGILLAVIAVLQTPAGRPLEGPGASPRMGDSPQCRLHEPAAPCPETAPHVDDPKSDCDFPARLVSN